MIIPILLPSKIDAFNLNDSQIDNLNYNNVKFINCKSLPQYLKLLSESEITITWKFNKEWYKRSPNLKFIFTPAAGHDWIDKDPNNNVLVIHGTFHGKLMGESLLGMILFMNRNFLGLINSQKECEWNRNLQSSLMPLYNQTILIAGFGNIAKEFCKIIKPFNCKIYGLQRTFNNILDENTGAQLITSSELLNILPEVDHLISILPADPSTDNFFKREHFLKMKKIAFFYNIGRGNCVDDTLIDEVVKDGLIAGASLDVFNKEPLQKSSPLWKNQKIFISPHSSAIFKTYLDLFFEEINPKLNEILNRLD